jgi:hypothetical protein
MNAVRSLAVRAVVAIGVVTLIANLIFHHHLGAQIFTGIAYLALAVALFFDLSTRPSPKSPFCQSLTPEEIKALQINNLALLYPGAAHFYAGALTAFAMVGALWAIAALLDHGYVTATLLVVYYFLTAVENIRLAPKEHIAKSAAAGNPAAILRQIHWKSINEKLAAHHEKQNAAAFGLVQRRLARTTRRDP